MIFETHAHYDDEKFDEDRAAFLDAGKRDRAYHQCLGKSGITGKYKKTDGSVSVHLRRVRPSPG